MVNQENPTLSGALVEGEVMDVTGYYGSGPSNGDLLLVIYSENNSEGFYIYNNSGPWAKAISDELLETRTWIFYLYNERILRSDNPYYSSTMDTFNKFNNKYLTLTNFKNGKMDNTQIVMKADMTGESGNDPYPYVYLFGI